MVKSNKGFTLIELLVVVGIIAILAIAALIAINPLEAQRRSRDAARLQDMARLSAAIEAYMNDTGVTGLAARNTTGTGRSTTCAAAGWLAVDLCQYMKQLPQDPQEGQLISALTNVAGTRANVTAGYGFRYLNGNYEFCTFLEGLSNQGTLTNDGGNDVSIFETGSNLNTTNCAP